MQEPKIYCCDDVEITFAPCYSNVPESSVPVTEEPKTEVGTDKTPSSTDKVGKRKAKNKKNKRRFPRWAVCLIVVVLILAIVGGVAIPASGVLTKGKKAIIYVTALLAGGFYDAETNEPIWDPLNEETQASLFDFMTPYGTIAVKGEAIAEIMKQIMPLLGSLNAEDGFINQLTLNEDGTDAFKLRSATMEDGRHKYGVLNSYKESYLALNEAYGSEYEVSIFNYDWRKDNRDSAAALEKFINDNGYTDVILLSHSMGGNVVANYLARSEENREKVNLYCSYGTPFLGSMEILTILEDPSSALTTMGDMSALTGSLGGFASGALAGITEKLEPLITHMTSFYQLLPTIELIKSSQYKSDQSCIYLDGKPIRTQEELISFYKSRPWAKNKDGSLKKVVAELEDYFDSVYVTLDNGERVHSTTLVDTHYFLGMNIGGNYAVRYVTVEGDYEVESIERTVLGDCQVLLYSGTAGRELYEADVYIYHVAHHALGILFNDFPKEVTFRLINENMSFWEKLRMRF